MPGAGQHLHRRRGDGGGVCAGEQAGARGLHGGGRTGEAYPAKAEGHVERGETRLGEGQVNTVRHGGMAKQVKCECMSVLCGDPDGCKAKASKGKAWCVQV